MSVYFIRAEDRGLIKIGVAKDPWSRLGKLRADCPCAVALLAFEDGDETREKELHERFASARLKGEWFAPIPELIAHIAALPKAVRSKKRHTAATALGRYLRDRDLSDDVFGAMIGLDRSSVSRLRRGAQMPRAATMRAIIKHTAGEVKANDFYGIAA